jgi:hypothetical protein
VECEWLYALWLLCCGLRDELCCERAWIESKIKITNIHMTFCVGLSSLRNEASILLIQISAAGLIYPKQKMAKFIGIWD